MSAFPHLPQPPHPHWLEELIEQAFNRPHIATRCRQTARDMYQDPMAALRNLGNLILFSHVYIMQAVFYATRQLSGGQFTLSTLIVILLTFVCLESIFETLRHQADAISELLLPGQNRRFNPFIFSTAAFGAYIFRATVDLFGLGLLAPVRFLTSLGFSVAVYLLFAAAIYIARYCCEKYPNI